MGAMIRIDGTGFDGYSLALERFQNNLSNAEPMFQALADQVAKSNKEQFDKRGAHYGALWAPLSPNYADWKSKAYPGQPIMVRTGDLRSSLTERPFGVEEVTSSRMVVGTGLSYASFHQNGTPYMPARPLVGYHPRKDRKRFSSVLHDWVVKGEVTQ